MEQKQIQIQKQDKTEKRRKSETEWLEEKRIVDNEPDKVKNLIQMLWRGLKRAVHQQNNSEPKFFTLITVASSYYC